MKKAVLSTIIAIAAISCTILSIVAFATSGDQLWAMLSIVFVFGVVAAIGYAVEDTKMNEFIVNFFSGEDENDD